MNVTATEVLYHTLGVVGWLIFQGALCWACEGEDMKKVLLHCSPYLGSIHTTILRTTDTNYTLTCREYKKYVTCIENRMVITCPDSIVRGGPLYEDYKNTVTLYSSTPFNCSLPEYVNIELKEKQQQLLRQQKLTTTPSSGTWVHNSSNWITIGCWCVMSSVIISFRNIAVT